MGTERKEIHNGMKGKIHNGTKAVLLDATDMYRSLVPKVTGLQGRTANKPRHGTAETWRKTKTGGTDRTDREEGEGGGELTCIALV